MSTKKRCIKQNVSIFNKKIMAFKLNNPPYVATAPDATNPKTVTFAVHADMVATTNPTLNDGEANSIYDAVVKAMTANPGGVKSTVSLPKDQAATPVQMYFSGATWA